MSGAHLIEPATESLTAIVYGDQPDQLDAPTPCTAYDVRALVNHLLFWGRPSRQPAARKPCRHRPPRSPIST